MTRGSASVPCISSVTPIYYTLTRLMLKLLQQSQSLLLVFVVVVVFVFLIGEILKIILGLTELANSTLYPTAR